jgi:hypothetical protein
MDAMTIEQLRALAANAAAAAAAAAATAAAAAAAAAAAEAAAAEAATAVVAAEAAAAAATEAAAAETIEAAIERCIALLPKDELSTITARFCRGYEPMELRMLRTKQKAIVFSRALFVAFQTGGGRDMSSVLRIIEHSDFGKHCLTILLPSDPLLTAARGIAEVGLGLPEKMERLRAVLESVKTMWGAQSQRSHIMRAFYEQLSAKVKRFEELLLRQPFYDPGICENGKILATLFAGRNACDYIVYFDDPRIYEKLAVKGINYLDILRGAYVASILLRTVVEGCIRSTIDMSRFALFRKAIFDVQETLPAILSHQDDAERALSAQKRLSGAAGKQEYFSSLVSCYAFRFGGRTRQGKSKVQYITNVIDSFSAKV